MANIIQANWPIKSQRITAFTRCRHTSGSDNIWQQNKLPSVPLWLNQCHSTTAIHASHYDPNQEADACYTQQTNQVLAIKTADCLPLILYEPSTQTIAAIHAGWRGLTQGIIENTLDGMAVPRDHIYAWMGPAISVDAFEIQQDCANAFIHSHPSLAEAVHCRGNQLFADLYYAARLLLNHHGVHHIYGGDYCTYSMPYSFFSYRRDKTKQRLSTFVWINSLA